MFRWGLIGAGDIAQRRVAPALRESPGSELVAVSRARAELLEDCARVFGARRWYPRWTDLVNDPDLDGVYIATPVHLHAEQTIAAARAGKHVLCEKPMAMDAAECDRMISACEASRVALGVAYYRRFYPVVARVKAIVSSGEIGRPVFAQMHAFEPFTPQPGFRSWLLDRARAGGGPMMDFGCHRLEVLLNLFGPVRETAGLVANVVFTRDVEDTAAALLQFADGPCASLAVTHAAFERQDTLHVFGTHGSVHCENVNAGELRVGTAEGESTESHPCAANVHRPLVDDFIDAVAAGRRPAVSGEVGRAVAVIEDAIYAVAPSVR